MARPTGDEGTYFEDVAVRGEMRRYKVVHHATV